MPRKRVLMACPNHWESPFQVGSHHLARAFVKAGWEVAFVSDPITPFHLAKGLSRDLLKRAATYGAGGKMHLNDRLWTYVPAAAVAGHNKPFLRSEWVHRCWHRWTAPNVVRRVREQGFGKIDLLYIDSISQAFWLDALNYRHSVYRLTDFSPHFEKFTPASAHIESEIARRVDVLLHPSLVLKKYVQELQPHRTRYFPNGVEYEHFAVPRRDPPPEYAGIPHPIAVYVGVMPHWFHFEWVRQAAQQLPQTSFVLIGPGALARKRLSGLRNVYILGCRGYQTIPAYLQHANVGIIPFNAEAEPSTVECLNPLKLYQYFAAGLPVVCSSWEAIRHLRCPARLCDTVEQFVKSLRFAVEQPLTEKHREYAARFDWNRQLQQLLDLTELEPRKAADRWTREAARKRAS